MTARWLPVVRGKRMHIRLSSVTISARMGHLFVDAELSWKRTARVRVLVDTGATHSVLPSDLADRLGVVRSPRPIRVELADGSHRSMRVGTVLVRLLGREAGDTALIARRGAEAVLGVEALEALGLTVDPRSRRLKPSRARAVLLVSTRRARR
jgi:clan AA aspartic protease